MGKGDRKTKKGKISMGTYGVSRPRSKNRKSDNTIDRPAKPSKVKEPKTKDEDTSKKPAKTKAATKPTAKKSTPAKKPDDKK